MRMDLKVPFAEKDEAKKLGARWDAARKLWFVDGKPDMAPFARWSPTPHAGAAAGGAPAARQAAGKLVIGEAYRAVRPVCDCPPWEECEHCRSLALKPMN